MMKDLESFELEERSDEPEADGSGDGDDRGDRRLYVGAAIAVVVLVIVGAWWWLRDSPPPQTAEPEAGSTVTESQPRPQVEVEDQAIDLPELDASDELVRSLAEVLSANPEFSSWLVGEGLVRRFTVVVTNVAEGESPRSHLRFLQPSGEFESAAREADLVIDPVTYRRFDPLVEIFLSLESEGSVELYRRLEPLFNEAYRELGYPDGRFENALRTAAEVVLATPRPEGEVVLEAGVKSFRFADPDLEGLAPAQKQLIRMGPANLAKVQAKVRALLEVLDDTAAGLR